VSFVARHLLLVGIFCCDCSSWSVSVEGPSACPICVSCGVMGMSLLQLWVCLFCSYGYVSFAVMGMSLLQLLVSLCRGVLGTLHRTIACRNCLGPCWGCAHTHIRVICMSLLEWLVGLFCTKPKPHNPELYTAQLHPEIVRDLARAVHTYTLELFVCLF